MSRLYHLQLMFTLQELPQMATAKIDYMNVNREYIKPNHCAR
jgi:hypothetical protein